MKRTLTSSSSGISWIFASSPDCEDKKDEGGNGWRVGEGCVCEQLWSSNTIERLSTCQQ